MKQSKTTRTNKAAEKEVGTTVAPVVDCCAAKDLKSTLATTSKTTVKEAEDEVQETINLLVDADVIVNPQDYPGTVFTYEEVMAIQQRTERIITKATLAEVLRFFMRDSFNDDAIITLCQVISRLNPSEADDGRFIKQEIPQT